MNSTSISFHAALNSTSPAVYSSLASCHRELGTICSILALERGESVDCVDGMSSFPHEQKAIDKMTANNRLTAPVQIEWGC